MGDVVVVAVVCLFVCLFVVVGPGSGMGDGGLLALNVSFLVPLETGRKPRRPRRWRGGVMVAAEVAAAAAGARGRRGAARRKGETKGDRKPRKMINPSESKQANVVS